MKVGDSVRIINSPYGGLWILNGNKTRITDIVGDLYYLLDSKTEDSYPFYETEIELVEESEETTESQNKWILKYLQSGATINPITALQLFGSLRLSARINDLRNDGHNIKTEMVYNGRKRWANYNLEQ